jgi:DNA-binding transcriptional regulator LsrR (DeoR family)
MPRNKVIDYRLLLKVSRLYYENKLTQQEISERMSLSRPKVSRLLKQAEDVGLIKISVLNQPGIHTELENQLEQKYGLVEAVVSEVSEPSSQVSVSREVGLAAAEYFIRAVHDPCVVGMAWGTTLRAMVDALPGQRYPHSQIVQLIGGLGAPESEAHATYILRRLVAQTGARLSILNVPGIVDSVEIKKAFLTDSHVKQVMDSFSTIQVAFVGVGVPTTDSVVMRDGTILSQDQLKQLIKSGAIGDICLRFFNAEGQLVKSEIDERVIGITLDDLKKIRRVVGVTGGPQKHQVIHAALKGGLITVLITDHMCAKKLLED